jgi:hypothetical protein
MDVTGHTSAKVIAQQKKGNASNFPQVEQAWGNAAHDIMGAISNNLFKVFKACSSALSASLFCSFLAFLSEYGNNFTQSQKLSQAHSKT